MSEARKIDKDEKELYKGTRWLLLKRPEKLREDQKGKLDRLLEVNKNLYKAYILRDEFRQVFEGPSSHSRLIRLNLWIQKAKVSRLSQINGFVKLIEKWKPFIRNSLRGNYSNSLDRTITLTPDDATTLLKISFTDLELETDYDYLYNQPHLIY